MMKTKLPEQTEKLTVDITTLQEMLCVGKNTCYQIGRDAGARIKIGRRCLFNVKKIQEYMDSISQ